MVKTVGILSLQGNYSQHFHKIKSLGANCLYVRYPKQLEDCDALIIPGGESTSISIQIAKFKFRQPLIEFSKKNLFLEHVQV